MKIISLILAFLLLTVQPSYAVVMVGFGQSTEQSYLMTEDFTAASLPSGWTNSSATFPGGYMQVVNGQYVSTSAYTAASGDEVYVVIKITLASGGALPTNAPNIIRICNASLTNLAYLAIGSSGKMSVATVPESAVASTNVVIAVGDTRYFKLKYNKSTHVSVAWSSTDGTTWSNQTTSSAGTSSADGTRLRLMSASGDSNSTWQYDGVRVSGSDINYL